MAYLDPEKEREMKNGLPKLDASLNAETFHRLLGYALTILDYKVEKPLLLRYDTATKEKAPIKDVKELNAPNSKTTVFIRREEYTKKGTTIRLTTVYLTSARVRGKKASLWFIRTNENWGIQREMIGKEALVEMVQEGMKEFETREKKLDYGRKTMEELLEKALIVNGNGSYYISFRDIHSLVEAHKA